MAAEIHLNDIGTVFELTINDAAGTAVDLTLATALNIILSKPDATVATKTAVLYGAGTGGKIRYTAIAGDLNQAGKYKIQAKVTLPTGVWSSDIQSFKVFANL
jgi:hypothetical protein